MDSTGGTNSVRAELDRKKERLEEIRRNKARKESQQNATDQSATNASSAAHDPQMSSAAKANMLLQQLGMSTARPAATVTPVPARDGVFRVPFPVVSHGDGIAGGDTSNGTGITPAKSMQHSSVLHQQQHAATAVKSNIQRQLDFGPNSFSAARVPYQATNAPNNPNGSAHPSSFYRPNLQIQVGLCRSSITPREAVRYDRETQTSGIDRAENPAASSGYYQLAFDRDASEDFKREIGDVYEDQHAVLNGPSTMAAAGGRGRNLMFSMSELSTEQHSLAEGADEDSADFTGEHVGEQLSDEQRQSLFANENFLKQFKHVTTVMERVLSSSRVVLPTSNTSSSTLRLTQSVSSMSQSVSSMRLHASEQQATTPSIVDGGGSIGSSALRDYYDGDDNDDDDERGGRSVNVSIRARFYDDKYCRGKSISHIAMSQQHSNLVAAAYEDAYLSAYTEMHASNRSGGLNTSFLSGSGGGGHIMIWNLDYPHKSSADDTFRSLTSSVTTCEFNTYHRSLLVGGTESGQICMWDMRSPRRTPVQTTAVSVKSHCHPVHSLHVGGAGPNLLAHSHDLVSCSTDGRVCSWNIDNLSQPVEVLDLHHRQNRLSTTCMRFLSGDWNNMLVGAEDGQVVSAYRHGQAPGIWEAYESHAGPVNSIDCHPKNSEKPSSSSASVDFSQLFLTCSFDWSVKLRGWREPNSFYTFSTFAHFVTDCKWSHAHPAVFAAADESGLVHFYNLNRETEIPIVKMDAGEAWASAAGGGSDSAALTKLAWDTNQGHILCAGDRAGRLTVMDARELMGPNGEVGTDEYARFARVVNDMRQRVSAGSGVNAGSSAGVVGGSVSAAMANALTKPAGGFAEQSSFITPSPSARDAVTSNADSAKMSPIPTTASAVKTAANASSGGTPAVTSDEQAAAMNGTVRTTANDAAVTVEEESFATTTITTNTASAAVPTSAAGFFNRILGSKS